MTYEVHPIANIFPAMSDAEFYALKDDISQHGLREPLWLYQGQVIDGRHRARACEQLQVVPETREFEGEDPVAFVVSLNLHRRHMSDSQRGIAMARAATFYEQGGDRRSDSFKASIEALKKTQEAMGVSDSTLDRSRKVVTDGSDELLAAVESGAVSVSAAAQVATLPKEMQSEIVSTGAEEVREVAKTIRNGPHVANNSGNNEWYTPPDFIEAARRVMGSIDLDPASSKIANKTVGAKKFFNAEQNGLEQQWGGNVWMNPPYSQPLVAEFSAALVAKYDAGEIRQACVLVNNATDTAWFRLLAEASSATCFTKGRVRFMDPQGNPSGAPLQGQAILYFGGAEKAFAEAFKKLGYVFVGRPVALAA